MTTIQLHDDAGRPVTVDTATVTDDRHAAERRIEEQRKYRQASPPCELIDLREAGLR